MNSFQTHSSKNTIFRRIVRNALLLDSQFEIHQFQTHRQQCTAFRHAVGNALFLDTQLQMHCFQLSTWKRTPFRNTVGNALFLDEQLDKHGFRSTVRNALLSVPSSKCIVFRHTISTVTNPCRKFTVCNYCLEAINRNHWRYVVKKVLLKILLEALSECSSITVQFTVTVNFKMPAVENSVKNAQRAIVFKLFSVRYESTLFERHTSSFRVYSQCNVFISSWPRNHFGSSRFLKMQYSRIIVKCIV